MIPVFSALHKTAECTWQDQGRRRIITQKCDFSIEKGYVRTSNFAAQGSNMSLEGGGWIRLSDLQVNSDFKLGLRGLPGFITSPVFLLAGGLFQVRGTGPLSNVSWSFAPFSGGKAPIPPASDRKSVV